MRIQFTRDEEKQLEQLARKKGQGVVEVVHTLVLQEIQAAKPPLDQNSATAQALELIKSYPSGKEFTIRDIIKSIDQNHCFLYTAYTGQRKQTADHALLGKRLSSYSNKQAGGYQVDRVEKEVNVYRKL